jgi:hypothetical protein
MLSGRHMILLGILACAGLLSVHDGQQQVDLCYQLGKMEKDLHDVRNDIQLARIKHRALQSPKSVMEKAAELHLAVRPPGTSDPAPGAQTQTPSTQVKTLGAVQPPRLPVPNVHVH